MATPRAVRSVSRRTIGSGTRLRDEMPLPAPVYYGSRAVVWMARHWRITGPVAAVVAVWVLLGSLIVAVAAVGACWGLTMWYTVRHAAEGRVTWREFRDGKLHQATLRRQWPLACKAAGLLAPGRGTAPALRRVKATDAGTLEATVYAGRVGVPVSQFQKHAAELAEVVGCREVVVTPTGSGVGRLRFHWLDSIGRRLALADLPLAAPGQLAYGIRHDGSAASVRLTQSVLLGGLTRSGKSSCIHALLADCIRQQVPVAIYCSDPKGGVELDAFESAIGATGGLVTVRRYAKTPDETKTMLEAVEKAMHGRQDWMKLNGVRTITPDAANPLVVTILDETLPLTDLLKKGTDSALGRVAYTGSAAAYVVWANTQVAQIDAIGRFRDLIPQRICFSTPNSQVTDSVLGSGADAAGAKCSEIRNDPGVGFSYSEGDHTPQKFRAAFVDDDEARMVASGRLPVGVLTTAEIRATDGGRTALYRHFNAADELLYVGITNDILRRTDDHTGKPWWHEQARETTTWHPTRKLALEAEKHAIQTEHPKYNDQHNGRWSPRAQFRAATRRPTA